MRVYLDIVVRFETFEKMKTWMVDIKNESQQMSETVDANIDWWEALFHGVSYNNDTFVCMKV